MTGCVLHLERRTRPDILAPIYILARFCNSPSSYCHKAAKRILRYLRDTWNHKIQCVAGSLGLSLFVESDHAVDTVTRRSMTAVVLRLGDAVCLLGAKRQRSVDRLTCEAEYYAMTTGAQESLWIGHILDEAGLDHSRPVPIRSDDEEAHRRRDTLCAGSCEARRVEVSHVDSGKQLDTSNQLSGLH
jgi:hypothetical protein